VRVLALHQGVADRHVEARSHVPLGDSPGSRRLPGWPGVNTVGGNEPRGNLSMILSPITTL